jgi:hypothetical protein
MNGNLGITSDRFSIPLPHSFLCEAFDQERKISGRVLGVTHAGEFLYEETRRYGQERRRFTSGFRLTLALLSLCHPDKVGLLD